MIGDGDIGLNHEANEEKRVRATEGGHDARCCYERFPAAGYGYRETFLIAAARRHAVDVLGARAARAAEPKNLLHLAHHKDECRKDEHDKKRSEEKEGQEKFDHVAPDRS